MSLFIPPSILMVLNGVTAIRLWPPETTGYIARGNFMR